MRAVILGSAAGGGLPQWNCRCQGCDAARRGEIEPRWHAAAALCDTEDRWFLFNASPDIVAQLSQLPVQPERHASPFEAVLLTDAELDATVGLLSLRQADKLCVYATEWVWDVLKEDSALARTLSAFCAVEWRQVEVGCSFRLEDRAGGPTGLDVMAFAAGSAKRPAFCNDRPSSFESVVGYAVTDLVTGRRWAYAPTIGDFDRCRLTVATCDCVVLDGTFWSELELRAVGREKTATDCGHVPIGGHNGTLARRPTGIRWIYTHLNNTNPVLVESAARQAVLDEGAEIAVDGMEIEL